MYGLGNFSDYRETVAGVMYLTPQRKKEVWLCAPLMPVSKMIDPSRFLWGVAVQFVDLDKNSITVSVNRKLINNSGISLAKVFSNNGLVINPGYERQFSAYLSVKLESAEDEKILAQVPGVYRLSA